MQNRFVLQNAYHYSLIRVLSVVKQTVFGFRGNSIYFCFWGVREKTTWNLFNVMQMGPCTEIARIGKQGQVTKWYTHIHAQLKKEQAILINIKMLTKVGILVFSRIKLRELMSVELETNTMSLYFKYISRANFAVGKVEWRSKMSTDSERWLVTEWLGSKQVVYLEGLLNTKQNKAGLSIEYIL